MVCNTMIPIIILGHFYPQEEKKYILRFRRCVVIAAVFSRVPTA